MAIPLFDTLRFPNPTFAGIKAGNLDGAYIKSASVSNGVLTLTYQDSSNAEQTTEFSGTSGSLAFSSRVSLSSVVSYTNDTWVDLTFSEDVPNDSIIQVRIRGGHGRAYVLGREYRSWTAHSSEPTAQAYRTAINADANIDLARGNGHDKIWVRCSHDPGSTYDIDVEMYPFEEGSSGTLLELSDTPGTFGTEGQVLAVNAATDAVEWVDQSGGGSGSTTFLDLTDTPSSFTAGRYLKVNSAGDALEEVEAPTDTTYGISISGTTITLTSGGTGTSVALPAGADVDALLELSDTPSSFGTAGQVLAVNSGATAAEWVDQGGGTLAFGDRVDLAAGTAPASEAWGEVTLSQAVSSDSILLVNVYQYQVMVLGSDFQDSGEWGANTTETPVNGIHRYPLNPSGDLYLDLARGSSHSRLFIRTNSSNRNYDINLYPFESAGSAFTDLSDTPSSLTAGKWLKVNNDGDALEETDGPSESQIHTQTVNLVSGNWSSLTIQGSAWTAHDYLMIEITGENARSSFFFHRTQLDAVIGSTPGNAIGASEYISFRYSVGLNDRKFYVGRRGGTTNQLHVAAQGGNLSSADYTIVVDGISFS